MFSYVQEQLVFLDHVDYLNLNEYRILCGSICNERSMGYLEIQYVLCSRHTFLAAHNFT